VDVNVCSALHTGLCTPGDNYLHTRLRVVGLNVRGRHRPIHNFTLYLCLRSDLPPSTRWGGHNMAFERRGGKDHGIIKILPFLGRGVKRCLGIPRRQGHGSIAAGVLLIMFLVFIRACLHWCLSFCLAFSLLLVFLLPLEL
jgi:hypothetical protein